MYLLLSCRSRTALGALLSASLNGWSSPSQSALLVTNLHPVGSGLQNSRGYFWVKDVLKSVHRTCLPSSSVRLRDVESLHVSPLSAGPHFCPPETPHIKANINLSSLDLFLTRAGLWSVVFNGQTSVWSLRYVIACFICQRPYTVIEVSSPRSAFSLGTDSVQNAPLKLFCSHSYRVFVITFQATQKGEESVTECP